MQKEEMSKKVRKEATILLDSERKKDLCGGKRREADSIVMRSI